MACKTGLWLSGEDTNLFPCFESTKKKILLVLPVAVTILTELDSHLHFVTRLQQTSQNTFQVQAN